MTTHSLIAASLVAVAGALTACLLGVSWLLAHADDSLVMEFEAGEFL